MNGILKRLWGIASHYRNWMALSALLGFLTVGSSVGLMMTSAFIIAKAALHPSIAELNVAIVGVRFFGIARGVFRYLERLASHETTFRLLARFRVWFYRHLEPLAPARLMQYRSSDLLTRLVSDVESLEHVFVRVLYPPIVAVLVLALMWLLLGMFNPLFALSLTLYMTLAGTAIPFLMYHWGKQTGQQIVNVRARLNHLTIDGVQGLPDLLVFGGARQHQQQFQQTSLELARLQRRMARLQGLSEALMGLLVNLAVFTILYQAIPYVSNSILNGVYLSVIVLGVMAAFEGVAELPNAAQFWEKSKQSAQRLFEIIDAEPEVQDSAQPQPLPNHYSLTVQQLTFAYQPGDSPVLRDISFTLKEGENLAIVGPSGAGKSTLFNLLLRFWEFREGSIRIGERDIREIPQEQVRALFAIVSQQSHLFAGTIRENLLLARPDASEEEMVVAARQAEIHDFVLSLPRGYDTYVGELGGLLSGGERQRLIIARALLKQAPILLYDEPTSNLDALTEQKIMNTIRKLGQQHTTLLITHRLVGLEHFSRILVLVNGQIIEQGTHAELMAQSTYYKHLFNQQRQIAVLESLR